MQFLNAGAVVVLMIPSCLCADAVVSIMIVIFENRYRCAWNDSLVFLMILVFLSADPVVLGTILAFLSARRCSFCNDSRCFYSQSAILECRCDCVCNVSSILERRYHSFCHDSRRFCNDSGILEY